MDITSYLLGKQAGGGGSATLQNNKEVTVTSNGSSTITPDSGYDGIKKVSLTTNVQPNLESKSVTISSNTTTNITPTSGKDGLSSVEVTTNVPGIVPTGTINITSNGTHDVTNYASASVNVPGGDIPTKGLILSNWDNDGYALNAEIVGMTSVPSAFFYPNSTSFFSRIQTITLDNAITSIGQNSFRNCLALKTINIPNNVTLIADSAFQGCYEFETNINTSASIGQAAFRDCRKMVTAKTTYNGAILSYAFYGCIGLKKACFPNTSGIYGGNSSNGAFINCSALKQVWLGSKLYNNLMFRYSFYGASNLEKMYIDLPRATVEAFTNYQYAFMDNASKVGIIICNDDEGFITEEQFDALDPNNM